MSFDVTKLRPGDEVGIKFDWIDGQGQGVGMVVAIHKDRSIELEGDEWFFADGRSMNSPDYIRLCEPTDEGRLETLIESIGVDLDILGGRLRSMDLPTLRNLRGQVLGWIAGVETKRTNHPVSAPDRSESA